MLVKIIPSLLLIFSVLFILVTGLVFNDRRKKQAELYLEYEIWKWSYKKSLRKCRTKKHLKREEFLKRDLNSIRHKETDGMNDVVKRDHKIACLSSHWVHLSKSEKDAFYKHHKK